MDEGNRYQIAPLFFDPRPDGLVGSPDIVIIDRDGNETGIQCKTKNPSSAVDMTFDVFQYLFGCFLRLVQDNWMSYRLELKLDSAFGMNEANLLLDEISTASRYPRASPWH